MQSITSFKMLPNIPSQLKPSSTIKLTHKSFQIKNTISSSSYTYIPNKIRDDSYIRIFDTTLRDGEQAAGATMKIHEKLEVAHQLATLGVDVIESGFPVSSNAEFEAVKLIAKEVGNRPVGDFRRVPVIGVLARCVKKDIDIAWEAVRHAKHPRINVFIPTSEIHMKYKLKKSKDEVLRIVQDTVSYARSLGLVDLGFDAEDAGRSNKEFMYQVCEEAIKAGATTITFADTVGCQFPHEWGQFIADMKANIVGVENVILATHCHNDLGLATANSLAAIIAGARQVEVTINGIGERAGNAPLEEVVMALKSRGEYLLGGLYTGINTKQIVRTSNMVERYSGLAIQPHKPIVGANAFNHASGIHQDGVLKHKSTYEIISREDIGFSEFNDDKAGIVLGKLSGRAAVKSRLQELGYELSETAFEEFFWRFKTVAENIKVVSNDDLIMLASKSMPVFATN